ncbi:unnamed protein product [Sphagnum balticum]
MREEHGQSRAMAKATATQFLSSLHQARRGRVRSRILSTGYKDAKQSAVTSRDPWTSGRQTCLSAGRAPLRASLRLSIPRGPKKSSHSRSQHYIPGPKQVIVFNVYINMSF